MDDEIRPLREALRLGAVFLVAGVLWIVATDWLVDVVAGDLASQRQLQTIKGILFVLIASGLFALLAYYSLSRAKALHGQIKAVSDQNVAGLYILQDGLIAFANPRVADIFGYSVEELTSMPVLDVVAPEDRELVRQRIAERMEGRYSDVHYRLTCIRKDGEEIRVEVHSRRSTWKGRPAIIGVLIDVTEQEREEARRRQSQRLEALGQLTGAVAHDFNNLLTAITVPLEICDDMLEDEHPAREELGEVRDAAQRAVTLTRQLLSFGRQRETRIQILDPSALVRGIEPVLSRAAGDGVQIHVDLSEALPAIRIDASEFEQVLLNLVVNAAQAMDGQGEVWIRTSSLHLNDDSEPKVVLNVADSGPGMDPITTEQAFEPFFTTREGGTGLGLATVHGIVTQAGGSISVDSTPGEGTVFTIRLPGRSGPGQPPLVKDERDPGRRVVISPGYTVLIVDDEDAVRRVTQRILERNGFDVLTASNAESALEAVRHPRNPIDLLLSDVSLPDLNGLELASRISKEIPHLPVVFMSGYSDTDLLDELAQHDSNGFLEKPFDVETLLATIAAALEARRETDDIA